MTVTSTEPKSNTERGHSVMLDTTRYVRKPFYVDAVRVTTDNIDDVAKWVGGDVRTNTNKKRYVKVRVYQPTTVRQTQAFVGDWVLSSDSGFKVYTNKAFTSTFEQAKDSTSIEKIPVNA